MPHSLRVKLKNLQRKGELTDKDIDRIFKALEQEPCEDAVNRQAVIDVIDKWVKNMGVLIALPANEVMPLFKSIHELLPVRPYEPRKGHWIYDYTSADGHKTYHCSECGCYLQPKHSEPLDSFRWCSLCGADMREVEE